MLRDENGFLILLKLAQNLGGFTFEGGHQFCSHREAHFPDDMQRGNGANTDGAFAWETTVGRRAIPRIRAFHYAATNYGISRGGDFAIQGPGGHILVTEARRDRSSCYNDTGGWNMGDGGNRRTLGFDDCIIKQKGDDQFWGFSPRCALGAWIPEEQSPFLRR